jgi:hypothetical protein
MELRLSCSIDGARREALRASGRLEWNRRREHGMRGAKPLSAAAPREAADVRISVQLPAGALSKPGVCTKANAECKHEMRAGEVKR